MKLKVSKSELITHLSIAVLASDNGTHMGILSNSKIDIFNNSMTITTTNLETTIQSNLTIESDADISMCVDPKLLLLTIRDLPDEILKASINETTITITSIRGRYKMPTFNTEGFPDVYSFKSNKSEFSVSSVILKDGISKTINHLYTNELMPTICGIFINVDSFLHFVSTNRVELSEYKIPGFESGVGGFILNKKPSIILKSIIDKVNCDVTVLFDENNSEFRFNNTRAIFRLVSGDYPNYKLILPKNNTNVATIKCEELIKSLKQISILSDKNSSLAEVSFSKNTIQIKAIDSMSATMASEELHCDYQGDDITVGLQINKMLNLLNNIDSDSVLIKLNTNSTAVVIVPSEEEKNAKLFMLIMPVVI